MVGKGYRGGRGGTAGRRVVDGVSGVLRATEVASEGAAGRIPLEGDMKKQVVLSRPAYINCARVPYPSSLHQHQHLIPSASYPIRLEPPAYTAQPSPRTTYTSFPASPTSPPRRSRHPSSNMCHGHPQTHPCSHTSVAWDYCPAAHLDLDTGYESPCADMSFAAAQPTAGGCPLQNCQFKDMGGSWQCCACGRGPNTRGWCTRKSVV